MTELLRCLYRYTLDHLTIDDPEYEENRRCSAAKLQALETALGAENTRLLMDYSFMRDSAEDAEREAIFCSALTAGIYFGSLCRFAE